MTRGPDRKCRRGIAPPLCAPRIQAIPRPSPRTNPLRCSVEQYEQGGSVKASNRPGFESSVARDSPAKAGTIVNVAMLHANAQQADLVLIFNWGTHTVRRYRG